MVARSEAMSESSKKKRIKAGENKLGICGKLKLVPRLLTLKVGRTQIMQLKFFNCVIWISYRQHNTQTKYRENTPLIGCIILLMFGQIDKWGLHLSC
jgi:hypothetical protein